MILVTRTTSRVYHCQQANINTMYYILKKQNDNGYNKLKQMATYCASSTVDSMSTPSTKLSKDSAALCFAFFFVFPTSNEDHTGRLTCG